MSAPDELPPPPHTIAGRFAAGETQEGITISQWLAGGGQPRDFERVRARVEAELRKAVLRGRRGAMSVDRLRSEVEAIHGATDDWRDSRYCHDRLLSLADRLLKAAEAMAAEIAALTAACALLHPEVPYEPALVPHDTLCPLAASAGRLRKALEEAAR